MATGPADLFVVKTQITIKLDRPIPKDEKEAKKLNALRERLFYYLLEIKAVEAIIDNQYIDDEDITCVLTEEQFIKKIAKYENYDVLFPGEYIQMVEAYNNNHKTPTHWIIWCKRPNSI